MNSEWYPEGCVKVGSHGFIKLVDVMGDEQAIAQAARTSYGGGTKTVNDDITLIRRLLRDKHTSPVEMVELKFLVMCPMDTWRQWIRHRTACLSGDTELVFERPVDGKAYRLNVKEVFDRFQPTENVHRPDKQKNASFKKERVQGMKLRCLNEETCVPTTTSVVDIWESGVKDVYLVDIGGKTIKCSEDHQIFAESGWKTLKELLVGDLVWLISSQTCEIELVPNKINPETEQWRPLIEWEDYYEISDQGRLRRITGGKGTRNLGFCKERTYSKGRSVVSLNRPGEQKRILVHREMLRTFVGEPVVGQECCHEDGNSLNNKLSNLYWGTKQENAADRLGMGRTTKLNGVLKRVNSIELVGQEMTYDLEVSGPWHNFSANDIVVHNSVNEYSTRYSVAIDEKAVTLPDEWRSQNKDNKQGSGAYLVDWPANVDVYRINEYGKDSVNGIKDKIHIVTKVMRGDVEVIDRSFVFPASGFGPGVPKLGDFLTWLEHDLHRDSDEAYALRLAVGMAREQARKDLPLSTYTKAYWKIDLHNFLHFAGLRMDSHAQLEIRQFAGAMFGEVEPRFPNVCKAFRQYVLDGMRLTSLDIQAIHDVVNNCNGLEDIRNILSTTYDNKQEMRECLTKMKMLGLNTWGLSL